MRIVDTHNDALLRLRCPEQGLTDPARHVTCRRMREGGLTMMTFAAYTSEPEEFGSMLHMGLREIDAFYTMLDVHREDLQQVCSPEDLECAAAAGRIGALLSVATGQQKSDRGGELGLALLFRNFYVSCVELAVSGGLEDAKYITDDLFLPVDEFKGLSRPCAFRMAQAFDEGNGIISRVFIVVRAFTHEFCGLVFLQFSDIRHLISNEKSRISATLSIIFLSYV